jgi:ATP-dependent DNA helicase RecG
MSNEPTLFALPPAAPPAAPPALAEQALDFVRRNTQVEARLENGRRVERWTYPEEAVRETIVNALAHRDYLLSSTDIELSLYEDRLEVVSPGRLPNDVTPERMRVGCRAARNQLLKDVMRDYGHLEHMGMGVPRKIVQGMRAHNGTEPDLVVEDERFLVRLWKEKPIPGAPVG